MITMMAILMILLTILSLIMVCCENNKSIMFIGVCLFILAGDVVHERYTELRMKAEQTQTQENK